MIRQKDFLIRQLEVVGAVIAKIFKLSFPGDKDEIEAIFTEGLKEFDLTKDSIRTLPVDEVIAKLGGKQQLELFSELVTMYVSKTNDPDLLLLKQKLSDQLAQNEICNFYDYMNAK